MKEVIRHSSAGLIAVYQSLMESVGIQTFVRNANTQQSLIGGLLPAIFPSPEFWPTLCVMNDEDYSAAMDLLRNFKEPGKEVTPEWTCAHCKESVPGHFVVCWNCGNALNQ